MLRAHHYVLLNNSEEGEYLDDDFSTDCSTNDAASCRYIY